MTTQYTRHTVKIGSSSPANSRTITDFDYVLVCDIETTTDFAQKMRFSSYVLYDIHNRQELEKGLISGNLSDSELTTITSYATAHNMVMMTHNDFIVKRLYPLLKRRTALVNHNIPFDLGGLAQSWYTSGNMFYLTLCNCSPDKQRCDDHPPIALRSLNFPKALIYVDSNDPYGPILDTLTIGRALLGPGDLSLLGMGARFKCQTIKFISEHHGFELDDHYIDYAVNDVKATLELFIAEIREYNRHGLSASIASIMSEASIGKAYLRELQVPPFYEKHIELPDWLNPTAFSAYYGARSEVKIRLQPVEIAYCDFKSQYPTVNALLGLQDLLLAEYITVKHNTNAVQKFLDLIQLEHLQKPEIWKKLRVLVKFAPNGDIVPNKFKTEDDNGEKVNGYAVCYTDAPPTWYTLADAIASKLLTGKTPKLIDAVCLYPSGKIPTQQLNLFGDKKYSIDLSQQDFFTEVINLRTSVKNDLKAAHESGDSEQVEYLDSLQLALKLLANSTSYGVLVETRYEAGTEVAGKYFASPVAVHITSGARLLLAIAERLGRDRGLTYAMCDTDSMAYARPDNMPRDTFYKLIDEIINWFTPLSPYDKAQALFELEELNFSGKTRIPLYFLGVSCKRYVVYNRNEDNSTYTIRKVTAHATGRYSFDRQLPIPVNVPSCPKKMKQWHYLLWYRAIECCEAGKIPHVPVEEWSNNIARYQESISTPGKANMYSYIPGVRPYSFFLAFPVAVGSKSRYIMPFVASHADILNSTAYRTVTMRQETDVTYDTLADRFSDFFSHAEGKAANGHETGILSRRKLKITDTAKRTRTGKTIPMTPDGQVNLWSQLSGN